MKVPLKVEVTKDTKKLHITHNGKIIEIDAPFKPYILTTAKASSIYATKRDVSTKDEITVFKKEYDDKRDMWNDRVAFKKSGRVYNISFIEQIFIDKENFFLDYPHEQDIKFHYFDIEVGTDGSPVFPKAKDTPIVCIGWGDNDTNCDVLYCNDTFDDKQVIKDWFKILEETTPDIIVGYNSGFFDLTYIYDRCLVIDGTYGQTYGKFDKQKIKKNGLAEKFLHFFTPPDKYRKYFDFKHGVHFDIYTEVEKDQLLSGIKNRRMKTLAEWYKIPEIVTGEDVVRNVKAAFKDGKLKPYIESDIHITRELCKIYFPKVSALAEFMKVPLHTMVTAPNSFCPKIFSGRHLFKRDFVALDQNIDRYNFIKDRKYEGAIVGISNLCPNCGKKVFIVTGKESTCKHCDRSKLDNDNTRAPGFIKKVWKYDFKSMYPSSMITWNLSPDTCKIERVDNWSKKIQPEYKFQIKDDYLWMQLPDANIQANFIMRIDAKKDGFMREEQLKLFDERNYLKGKMKEAYKNGDKFAANGYNSQQNSVKVILNTGYGYNGLNFGLFADMSVAIAVCAMCRWTTNYVHEWLEEAVVEIDTDGLAIDGDYLSEKYLGEVLERINKTTPLGQHTFQSSKYDLSGKLCEMLNVGLDKLIEGTFGFKNYMILEPEEFDEGYFYRAKNYCLLEEGKVIKHGVSFKASSKCAIYDKAMEIISEAVLRQDKNIRTIVQDIKNMDRYKIPDFAMSTSIQKPLTEYKSKTCLAVTVGKQAEGIIGRPLDKGDTVYYVKTLKPKYTVLANVTRNNIDKDYYLKQIETILNIFNIKNTESTSLFDFV